MPRYKVTARGYSGRSIFDPNLRGERRHYEFDAENEDEVRRLFQEAVDHKVDGVIGTSGSPFTLESITEV